MLWFAVHNPAIELIAFLNAFDNDHTDAIAGFVNTKWVTIQLSLTNNGIEMCLGKILNGIESK